jgi:hypothetical protein
MGEGGEHCLIEMGEAEEHRSIEMNREAILIATRPHPVIDPNWCHVDALGHTHTGALDTLDWVVTGTYWCGLCNDEHEEGEYRCKQCGDVIEPGTKWTRGEQKYVPGLKTGVAKIGRKEYDLRREEIEALDSGMTIDQVFGLIASRPPDREEF